MLKNDKVHEVSIKSVKPYENNAKIHTREQVRKIAESIREFGFLNPILIDAGGTILAGHGRVEAAKLLGLDKVPALYVEGLTEAQKRAYTLADNRLAELAEWDEATVRMELEALQDMDFRIEITGFDLPDGTDAEWFTDRKKYDNANDENESEEYQDFVQKFEQKRTTDDCYTPDLVYDAVADYVAATYHIPREKMARPFYPGGDYTAEDYTGRTVVDNPPFSILSEIVRWYMEHGVRFFLFAPTLALFSGGGTRCCAIPTANAVTYENGANVNTSFLTNLEPEDVMVKTAPGLFKILREANTASLRQRHAELPNYVYPDNVITSALVAKWSRYGLDFVLHRGEAVRIDQLDSQKEYGKSIYGYGYLMNDAKAAERAHNEEEWERLHLEELTRQKVTEAQHWPLSEREKELIRTLGGGKE